MVAAIERWTWYFTIAVGITLLSGVVTHFPTKLAFLATLGYYWLALPFCRRVMRWGGFAI
jgi:hypothetical protein